MLLVDQLIHLTDKLVQVNALVCNLSYAVAHIFLFNLLLMTINSIATKEITVHFIIGH